MIIQTYESSKTFMNQPVCVNNCNLLPTMSLEIQIQCLFGGNQVWIENKQSQDGHG